MLSEGQWRIVKEITSEAKAVLIMGMQYQFFLGTQARKP
jgi:hypothetical protein